MTRKTQIATLAFGALTTAAAAQSDIDPANKEAWGENVGWTNWQHDAPDFGDGVIIGESFLSGFIWGENIGWINLGDGDPGNAGGSETAYGNENGEDAGVNLDPNTGELFGLAWAENVGWINFDGGAWAEPPVPARLDVDDCRFYGYVWGENIGWINLDDLDHFVAPVAGEFCEEVPTCDGDANGDGVVDPLDAGFVLARFGCDVGVGKEDCDSADQNVDGLVDPLDSGFVLARFGPCP